jgi:Tfp pilus assembly protein PilV
MKLFHPIRRKNRLAFSLAEASLAVGLLSFGFLSLIPMVGLGLNSARQARDNRAMAQIAETFTQKARQGTLTAGTSYLDNEENSCASTTLTRLAVQVTPLAAPNRSQFYAVLFSPQ